MSLPSYKETMENLSGETIKGYVLREMIGVGGFAAVYRAYQPAVGREVAIKIILPRYANDPDFVRRFETEAQLIARLEHLHIVPLYDYWREPNNAYLVMRWLRGGNVATSIDNHGAWDLHAVARLLDQVGAALTAAHRQGIVHQDINPSNILLDEAHNAYLADFGIARDITLDGVEPLFGVPAYIAPERIRREPPSPQSDIYSLGIVLYELLTGKAPFHGPTPQALLSQQLSEPLPSLCSVRPDLPPVLDVVVLRAAAKDAQERYADAITLAADFRRVLGLVEDLPASPPVISREEPDADRAWRPQTLPLAPRQDTRVIVASLEPENPYKGLRAFEEADARDFFGREALVQRLVERIADPAGPNRFLAVVGPSGSGKSSVVKAGLIPALRRGTLPGSHRWFFAKMAPGAHPFEELTAALLGVTFGESAGLLSQLQTDERGLFEVARQILPDDETDLVLVIDQFEELFTLVDDEAERNRFLAGLSVATTQPDSRLRVIVTLRADFYDRPLLYSGFAQLMRECTEVVLPLSPGELQKAIVRPAERAGLTLEPGLVTEIVADVVAQAGALPLLQYALTELYERREDRQLTLAAYRASGGVLGALARRAEELYSGMDAPHQETARQLFLRLVSLRDSAEDARRRVRWAELISISQENKKIMQEVMDAFGKYRLLTFDRDPQTREPTVEVAHEALIRQWDRLRGWLADSREALLIQRRLSAATADWIDAGRNPSFLATGARLVQFETLTAAHTVALTGDETAYLRESTALRRRAARRLRLVVAVLAVLTLASIVLAVFARDRQRRAETAQSVAVAERDRADVEAQISRSRELAATSLSRLDQIDLALLLSLEALDTADTFEARNSLLTVLQSEPYLAAFLHGHSDQVRTVAFSPDGKWLASGSRDGTVILWDIVARRSAGLSLNVQGGRVNSVAFSPDGRLLASGSDSGAVELWDVQTGQRLDQSPEGHADAVWSVAFSPDGRLLASGSEDSTIRLWEVETGQPVGQPLQGHTDSVYSVAFSPDGRVLASGGADNTVRLWEVETGQPVGQPLQGHTDWVWSVAFSPDGKLVASGSADNMLRLWDAQTGQPVGDPLAGHTNWVRSVAFSPDGQTLVSASVDGTVRIWDVATGLPTGLVLAGQTGEVWSVAYHPDGHTLATAGTSSKVALWDLQAPYPLREQLQGHREAVLSVAFSPDGRLLASGGGSPSAGGVDNAVRLWDRQTGDAVAVLTGHQDSVSGLAFSPDGRLLASSSYDGTLIVWDVESRQPAYAALRGHTSPVLCVAFRPDGKLVASGSDDGAIIFWDVGAGRVVGDPLLTAADSVMSLAFSPDGRTLASGQRDATLRLWDVATQQSLGDPLGGHTDAVTSVVFSPDGQTLASGSRDGTVILWDVATRQPIRPPLTGHSNWVLSVAFSPDARWLISASRDSALIVRDVETGRPVGLPFAGHLDWVTSVAVSPDGQTAASGSWDRTVGIWDAGLKAWQARACQVANRDLSTEEVEDYFSGVIPPNACPALDGR
jgi:WD40 repeat protein